MKPFLILLILISGLYNTQIAAAEGWLLKPYFGMSQLSDTDGAISNVDSQTGTADISIDSGFVAGMAVGYRYNDNISAEFAWEYRSNDSETTLNNNTTVTEGNYASNTFALNGYYHLSSSSVWQPYLGLGLSWVQEIDIDLEQTGSELSYSGNGDIGVVFTAGVSRTLSDDWELFGELRYSRISDIDLEGEGTPGSFSGLDYKHSTLQLGVSRYF